MFVSNFSDEVVFEYDFNIVSGLFQGRWYQGEYIDMFVIQMVGFFVQRLQVWKYVVGYFEEYVEVVEKVYKNLFKEYERVLKV